MNQVRSPGCVESITLPSGFESLGNVSSTYGNNWLKRYGPSDQTKMVELCLASTGFNHLGIDLEPFREAIASCPSVLFHKDTGTCNADLICGMTLVLGRPGENQVWNPATGPGGPGFELEKMDTTVIAGKPVVRLEGWFQNDARLFLPADGSVDMGPPGSFLYSIYIDTNPAAERAKIEEIYLQCATRELLIEYLPVFEKSLATITWGR